MSILSFINQEQVSKEITLDMKERSLRSLKSDDMDAYRCCLQKLLVDKVNKLIENNSDTNAGVVYGIKECIRIQFKFRDDLKRAKEVTNEK